MSDEAVRKSRELNPNCGCERRGDRQFNCSYHEGFIDGCEAGRSAAIQECADKLRRLAKARGCDEKFTVIYLGCAESVLALKER